MHAVAV